jgi:hypothetical protein
MPAAAHSPATAQRRQRPASPVIARAEPGRSHPSALIHYTAEAISHATPHPQATPPYRCPTPHRSQIPIGRVPHPPAVSSLGGFRTPAARASGEVRACGWPASENLHRLGRSAMSAQCPVSPEADTGAAAPALPDEGPLRRCQLAAVVTAREQVTVDIAGDLDRRMTHAAGLYDLHR